MSYSTKLRDPRWQKKRLEVFQRDCFKCCFCGDDKATLHVHHLDYAGDPWDQSDENLITYCKHCHLVVEYFKKYAINIIAISKIGFEDDVFIIAIDTKKEIFFVSIMSDSIHFGYRLGETIIKEIINFLQRYI